MIVAISGMSGFIGRNLKEYFEKKGYEVVGISREILYDYALLECFFRHLQPNYIINTASYGNSFKQQDETETIQANILVPFNLLEASLDIKYKGFVNFSSSSAGLSYETFYSAGKASGERIVRAFVNKYNKPVISVRPFTVIGVGEQEEHLIPTLIRSCLSGSKMPFVYEPVHDFVSVSDVCIAVEMLLKKAEGLKGNVIDIGTGKSKTNHKIKDIVEKLTGKKANLERSFSLRPYDCKRWSANPDVLEYLGWKPQPVEETISCMVNAMKAGLR